MVASNEGRRKGPLKSEFLRKILTDFKHLYTAGLNFPGFKILKSEKLKHRGLHFSPTDKQLITNFYFL